MRKISLLIAALALVLGLSQCKKQEEPVASGEKQHIVLNASFGGGNSKIADNGTGGLKWTDEDGHKDIIKVYNSSETEIGTLECTDAAKGTFEGEITASEDQITFTFGTKPDIYTNQTGDLEDAIYLESAKIDYRADGNYGEVKMNMPHAVLKLDLSALGTDGGTMVTISNASGTVATVTGVTIANKVYYVAMPAAASTTYTFSSDQGSFEKTWTLVANAFYTAAGVGGDPTGEAIVVGPGTVTWMTLTHIYDILCYYKCIPNENEGYEVIEYGICFSMNEEHPNLNNAEHVMGENVSGYDFQASIMGCEYGFGLFYITAYAKFISSAGDVKTVYSETRTEETIVPEILK